MSKGDPISVRLTQEQADTLAWYCAATGKSRSEAIRDLIDRCVPRVVLTTTPPTFTTAPAGTTAYTINATSGATFRLTA